MVVINFNHLKMSIEIVRKTLARVKALLSEIEVLEELIRKISLPDYAPDCQPLKQVDVGTYFFGSLCWPERMQIAKITKDDGFYRVELGLHDSKEESKEYFCKDLSEFNLMGGKFFDFKIDLNELKKIKKERDEAQSEQERSSEIIFCKQRLILDCIQECEQFFRYESNGDACTFFRRTRYWKYVSDWRFAPDINSRCSDLRYNYAHIERYLKMLEDTFCQFLAKEEIKKKEEEEGAKSKEIKDLKDQINNKFGMFFWTCFIPLALAVICLIFNN